MRPSCPTENRVVVAHWAGSHRPDRKICGAVGLRSLNATVPAELAALANWREALRAAVVATTAGGPWTTVYVNFRDLPEPMTQELVWLQHREAELGRKIHPDPVGCATRLLRLATQSGGRGGRTACSLLSLPADQSCRTIAGGREVRRGRERGDDRGRRRGLLADVLRNSERPAQARGRVALQSITMPHDRMQVSRRAYTWINKYIFPGVWFPPSRRSRQPSPGTPIYGSPIAAISARTMPGRCAAGASVSRRVAGRRLLGLRRDLSRAPGSTNWPIPRRGCAASTSMSASCSCATETRRWRAQPTPRRLLSRRGQPTGAVDIC
jgi:Mycolic acid cyclopropane synthetase